MQYLRISAYASTVYRINSFLLINYINPIRITGRCFTEGFRPNFYKSSCQIWDLNVELTPIVPKMMICILLGDYLSYHLLGNYIWLRKSQILLEGN